MLEDVKGRLEELGYTVKDGDELSLTFCIAKVESSIKNDCNVSEIPVGLMKIAIDMVVGEFLLAKKTFAPADLTNFNLNYAVKQIQSGDTNTVFVTGEGSLTPEQRLTAFINYLLTYGKSEFSAYRSIRW
jgi:hypothetical protein